MSDSSSRPEKADDQVLLSADRGGVRTLTLNRPERKNALDARLWVELADALREVKRDRDVRALVLTGAGGAFSSGADIGTGEEIHPRYKLDRLTDVALALHELTVPTVAKVTGIAVGAGWNPALGCDLVVATPESRFCQIFAKRGLSVDLGGSWLLPRIVGLQQAKRLVLLADMIGAGSARTRARHLGEGLRRDRRVRRRVGRPAGHGATVRAGAEQGAAQRRRQRHAPRGAGQRSPGAAR